jgi:hypothetical protein
MLPVSPLDSPVCTSDDFASGIDLVQRDERDIGVRRRRSRDFLYLDAALNPNLASNLTQQRSYHIMK